MEVLFRIARLYVGSKIVCFYKSDHAFKTIWQRPCLCHLIKIKGYFLKPGRPVFIIVINTSCSGVYYRMYTRNKNSLIMPDDNFWGIFAGRISCNKRPHNRYLFLHSYQYTKILIMPIFQFVHSQNLKSKHLNEVIFSHEVKSTSDPLLVKDDTNPYLGIFLRFLANYWFWILERDFVLPQALLVV